MNINEFEHVIQTMVPAPIIHRKQYGRCTWLELCFPEMTFAVELIPGEGIGFSELDFALESDFRGHDKMFLNFETVLEEIKGKLAQ